MRVNFGVVAGVLPLFLVAGCDRAPPPAAPASTEAPAPTDPLAARDDVPASAAELQALPIMQAQVVLDRLGFTPGVIDGRMGLSTHNAVRGFQEAQGLPVSGEFDADTRAALARWRTIPATRVVTIPADFAAGPFTAVPRQPARQAELATLGYASLAEKLAERFHTTPDTLAALNRADWAQATGADPVASGTAPPPPPEFRAGQQIRVPNVGRDRIDPARLDGDAAWGATLAMLGVGTDQPKVDRIVVSKSAGVLKAYDGAGRLVAVYTATMGSEHDPLPLGQWKINGVSRNPTFHYNPALFWDARPGERKATIRPGPNNPVGVVWIDLSKPHYGIHGTPSPEAIGRAESHGCVRLTNWDAARLALMVHPGTDVRFEA